MKSNGLTFTPQSKLLIGVVHLRALPGAPRHADDMAAIVKAAVADARAYADGGADAVVVENFGDIPFTKGAVPHETIAAMAVAGSAVRQAVKLPLGFNVLRNDAHAALALCAACGGAFIRVNVHSGAMLTDQGVIEGKAFETLRLRRQLAPNALIVSGTGTGVAADLRDVERVRAACPEAVLLLGSGVTAANAHNYLRLANGAIVGTSLKRPGGVRQPVDERRVAKLARAMKS